MLGTIGRQGDHGDVIDILISIEQQLPMQEQCLEEVQNKQRNGCSHKHSYLVLKLSWWFGSQKLQQRC